MGPAGRDGRAASRRRARQGGAAPQGEKEAERGATQKALQEQSVYADQLTGALRRRRLKQIKLRQGTLKAKARANRDGTPVGEDLGVQ